jgi:lysophospholipase L1-like esterase
VVVLLVLAALSLSALWVAEGGSAVAVDTSPRSPTSVALGLLAGSADRAAPNLAVGRPGPTWSPLAAGRGAAEAVGCLRGGKAAALSIGDGPATRIGTATMPVAAGAGRLVSGSATRTRAVAAFLGDSYTSGYNGAGYGSSGWPAIVSASLGLRPLNRAVPGTGFVNPGWTGQPIRTQVTSVIRADPRVVFLAGGHNDRRFPTAATRAAAVAVIDRLHRALPDARLVVIGPIWSGDIAPGSLLRLRDALRRKAAAVGAIFVDPIRGGWLAGDAKRYIGPDGLHPTNAGHRHIAALVLRALRAAGRPGSARPPAPTVRAPVTVAPALDQVRGAPIGACAS